MEKQIMSKSKATPKKDIQYAKDYVNWLTNYSTENVDNTLNNMTTWASNDSANNMSNIDFTFDVDASDAARQQAQDATYQAYVDRLTPQFERQTSDMQSRLANQGISVGSEAYQRAMGDLQDNQNEALNQAGYQSVLAGQQAYNQDLQNQIAAGSFGNSAAQQYINALLSSLEGSASGYEHQQNLYAARKNLSDLEYQNALIDAKNKKGGLGGAITGAIKGGIQGFAATGNPWGAAAGAAVGGYSGYNSRG
jgi:hypothetical protein